MRVVSLVPSWTETLIEARVNVVGRTRYCVHPASAVPKIPVVGGTKKVEWEKVAALKPDLVIMDQEENPREFVEQCKFPWVATHVTSLETLGAEMRKLSWHLETAEGKNVALESWADELQQLLNQKPKSMGFMQSKAFVEWINRPEKLLNDVVYVIWKNPWTAVSSNTFIGSMLEYCGARVAKFEEKYPKINIGEDSKNLYLFSSEPYAFWREIESLKNLSIKSALVDGECFSWFGIRSLRFLRSLQASNVNTSSNQGSTSMI